jgi:hypothetical protein
MLMDLPFIEGFAVIRFMIFGANRKKRLFLHIGTEKTGTTSIQKFLGANREWLNRQGIAIPAALGDLNNKRLYLSSLAPDTPDPFFERKGVRTADERKRLSREWRKAFAREVATSRCDTWIVSSEFLQSRLRKDAEIQNLQRYLLSLFDTVSIVLYIRNPIEAATSLMSTGMKAGVHYEAFPGPKHAYYENICNHRRTIERWTSHCSRDISVRLFDRDFFSGGSLIADFCAATGIVPDSGMTLPPPENASLSKPALRILNAVNAKTAPFVNGTENPAHGRILQALERHFAGLGRFHPTSEQISAYDAAFSDSNEWVRSQFFPERECLFRPFAMSGSADIFEMDRDMASLADVLIELADSASHSGRAQVAFAKSPR